MMLNYGVTISSFKARRPFCVQDELSENAYRLTEGVAQAYRLTGEGRRQILDFYTPGDFIGLEGGGKYSFFVDAITDGECQIISRAEINPLLSDSAVSVELWQGLAAEVQRNRDHILRLSRHAIVRVASFIIQMHDRLPRGDAIHLPMPRQAVADYLGLTIETVSRALRHLQRSRIVTVRSHYDVTVLDWQKLRRLVL